jgi:hypothetical protein
MAEPSVPQRSRRVMLAVILGGRVVDGWIDPKWAKEQAEMHTCKTCGGPLAAPGRDGEGLVAGLSTCTRCGAVHRFDFYALRRWPNDTGTAYEAHLQTPGREVQA